MSPIVVLMGLRGSGKTTVGPMIASRLHVPFIDLDNRTRDALRAPTVTDAWKIHGEPAFRAAEVRCLRDALAESPSAGVISLGGGTPTAPGAADILRTATQSNAILPIYLRATPDTLAARLRATGPGDRPSLTGTDPISEIAAVFAARDPLYRELAKAQINIDALTPNDVAREVMAQFRAATGRCRTVFLDRDGVINRRLPDAYVRRWDEFEFLPGSVDALRLLREHGVFTVVITNQRGIARGLFTLDDLAAVHRRMQEELAREHATIDAIYACPDLEGPRRKPEPGMILDAIRDFPSITPATSLLIGDAASDIEAGHHAGIRGVLVTHPGEEDELEKIRTRGLPLAGHSDSLLDAVRRFVV